LIRYFYEQLLQNKKIVTHVYNDCTLPRLDLLYIDDAVAGLEKVITDRVTPIHHLGAGRAYTPRQIAEQIATILNGRGDFEEMRITDDLTNILLDSRESRQSLNWVPRIDLAEGLRRTVASFANASSSAMTSVSE
jgi:nucleoside-diphosphate-sugar epimerase